jgi:hypothetical protein
MDLLAELTSLVGTRVTGEGNVSFSWADVATLQGQSIVLESPEPLNSEWDESDLPRSDLDLEDEEGW